MRRFGRIAVLAGVSLALVASLGASGCKKQEKAPVLTQQQLQAGVIGKEHPVDQATATQMGCSCHTQAAQGQ